MGRRHPSIGRRLELYAEFGVPEVWLADAAGSWVEMHRRPVEGAYTETRRVEVGSPEEELVTERKAPRIRRSFSKSWESNPPVGEKDVLDE